MNDSKKIIELIFKLADNRKLSMSELAKRVNVAKSSLSRYKSGQRDFPVNDIGKYAKVLNVPVEYLLGLENNSAVTNEYKYSPESISAGLPLLVDGVTNYDNISMPDELMGKYAGHKDIIISKINGDSMDKLMNDGSFIAIKQINNAEALNNGDIVVFSHNHEYSVKYFYKHDDMLIFKPYSNNPVHYDQSFSVHDGVVIHGKVVTYIVNLD